MNQFSQSQGQTCRLTRHISTFSAVWNIPKMRQLSYKHLLYALPFLLIVVLTVIFRFYLLDSISYGLHLDESFNGLDAYGLVGRPFWEWPVFFKSNFGREPLHIWLTAILMYLTGPTKLTLRLVPAIISVLVTPAIVWLGWELGPYINTHQRYQFALLSGLAVLTMLWSQMHARILVRGGLFLLIEILIFASLWRALNTRRLLWWSIAGVFSGLSLYTYLPARFLFLIYILMLLWIILKNPRLLKDNLHGAFLFAIISIAIFLPLGCYFIQHPEDFLNRSSQVSIFNNPDISIMEQIVKVMGMAFIRGDTNLRMNYPGRPVLDVFMVVPFLVGLVITLRNVLKIGFFFLVNLAVIMLLPTVLSLDPPNFGRAIGALPFFALIIALGLEFILRQIRENMRAPNSLIGGIFVLVVVFISITLTWRIYYIQLPSLPDRFYMWDEGPTRLAYHVKASDPTARVYIGPGIQGLDHPTVQYLLLDQPKGRVHGFDGRYCVRVSSTAPTFYYFINNDFVRGPALLQSYLFASQIEDVIYDYNNVVWAKRVIQMQSENYFPEMIPHTVTLGDGIYLEGYWLSFTDVQPNDHLYVRLFWRVNSTPQRKYTSFVHLVQIDANGNTSLVAGSDSEPGKGACPTDDWMNDETIVDEKEIIVPDNFSPNVNNRLFIEVGFYTYPDGQRLEIPGEPQNRILLGPLS